MFELGLLMHASRTDASRMEFVPSAIHAIPTAKLHVSGNARVAVGAEISELSRLICVTFFFMAPRGSMKTSVGADFLATAILCAHIAPFAGWSVKEDTTAKFLKAFKALWEVGVDPAFARLSILVSRILHRSGGRHVKASRVRCVLSR